MKAETPIAQSSWLSAAAKLNKELQQQDAQTQQAMKELSKRQYRPN